MKEHNIKKGTLKIGTLNEYRVTECQQVADRHEGVLTFNIKFEGEVKIPHKFFSILFSNVFTLKTSDQNLPQKKFLGAFHANVKRFELIEVGVDHVLIRDSEVILTRESPNNYIFCMSNVRKMRDCIDIFPDYNDYWYMTTSKAHAFSLKLGKIIENKIKQEVNADNMDFPASLNVNNLTALARHGKVLYTPREIHIYDGSPTSIDSFMQKMTDMAFIKPPHPFEAEKEYRFHYTLICDNMILEPTKNSLIVQSHELLDLIL